MRTLKITLTLWKVKDNGSYQKLSYNNPPQWSFLLFISIDTPSMLCKKNNSIDFWNSKSNHIISLQRITKGKSKPLQRSYIKTNSQSQQLFQNSQMLKYYLHRRFDSHTKNDCIHQRAFTRPIHKVQAACIPHD